MIPLYFLLYASTTMGSHLVVREPRNQSEFIKQKKKKSIYEKGEDFKFSWDSCWIQLIAGDGSLEAGSGQDHCSSCRDLGWHVMRVKACPHTGSGIEGTKIWGEELGSYHLWYVMVKRFQHTCLLVPRSCWANSQKGNNWIQ